jgi:anti-sigma factor RsiW
MTQDPRIDPYFEDLPAYALGALDPDARLALEAHLESCPVCSAELDGGQLGVGRPRSGG